MAAETPFGLSFGDPRRYMGKSPLAEIGNAAKSFLTGYAIQESGLEKYLNEKGVKKNPQGGYSYSAPSGSIPPAKAASPAAVPPPQQSLSAMPPQSVQPAQQGVVNTPVPNGNLPPSDIGEQILNNTWTGFPSAPTGPTSLINPTDFNPFVPDTGNQIAMTGNEYQQAPGFGKLQKIAGQFMGMG